MGKIPAMGVEFAGAFGFVGAPVEQVAHELTAWHEELGFRPSRRDSSAGLSKSAQLLLPLTSKPYGRNLLVGTRSPSWTAYFDASTRGGDPRGATSVLARRLGTAYVVVYSIPFADEEDAVPGISGALQWEYSPDARGDIRREVALVEQEGSSGLHFEAWGPLQEWEYSDAYSKRRKRDRFSSELIAEYCRNLGIEPFDLAFYTGPSVLIERTT
ncbi:MAG TPA: hypothetical protein PLQ19_07860 [Aeromicrobium sp.]|nr:hypothetical protein [Aeromicrobium sp.]